VDAIAKVLDPALKTIVHIPNVNARESLKDKEREVNEIMSSLGDWKGIDRLPASTRYKPRKVEFSRWRTS
jgi:hypothetical protein